MDALCLETNLRGLSFGNLGEAFLDETNAATALGITMLNALSLAVISQQQFIKKMKAEVPVTASSRSFFPV